MARYFEKTKVTNQRTHLAAQPGVALSALDRIRIVPDTVLCGLTGSATMHSSVLVLTSPSGARYSVSTRLSPLSIRIGSDHHLMIQTLAVCEDVCVDTSRLT